MLINLTDVLTSEDKVIQMKVPSTIESLDSKIGCFKVADKTELSLTLTNLGTNKASVEGHMELSLCMECDRCLKPVLHKMKIDFIRAVSAKEEYSEAADEDEEQDFMEGYQLNIDDLLLNECFINLPMKVLCKPDCKGICMQCGKDLNTGECDCDTFVPDPRMARIKDIFDGNKEV